MKKTPECKNDSPNDSVGWKNSKKRGWLTQ
jgi:hypothetical protein